MKNKKPKLPNKMSGKLEFLREQLLSVQSELSGEMVVGEAGDGAVKITLTGDQRCVEVSIDPDLFTETDAKIVEGLVMVALNSALARAHKLTTEHLAPLPPNPEP